MARVAHVLLGPLASISTWLRSQVGVEADASEVSSCQGPVPA
jgi:hypothetical protein